MNCKLESYKLPTCCDTVNINNSQHYPGWTSGDNISGSFGEEYNDCYYLESKKFNSEKHPCWGQVIWFKEESSIDFVQNLHICEGHALMIEDNTENISCYIYSPKI